MSNALAESLLRPWEGPAILLVDLDAFFASVEQLDHPGWRGKPVIVGGDADKHGVVSTASYEARAFGVHSAQPASVARRLCPDAIWTHGHFDRYREMSETIMSILRDETPLVQQVSIDEAFVDVSPTKVNTEHPVRIAERELISHGVRTLGDLASADESLLRRIFGKNAIVMRTRAQGGDMTPVEEGEAAKSVSNEMTFAKDLTSRVDVEAAIATMAAKVGRRLRKKGLAGRTLSLKLRFGDRSVRSVQKRLPAPSDDELAFTPLLYRMVDEVWCEGIPVRLLGVGMSGFREDEYVQDTLFDVAREAPSTLDAEPVIVDDVKRRGLLDATDALRDRFGEGAVRFGHELRNAENTTGTGAKNPDDYK